MSVREHAETIRNAVLAAQVELSARGEYKPEIDAEFMAIWRATDNLLEMRVPR